MTGSESHVYFLRRAIALAEENITSGRGGPFGAVLVRNGQILAEGTNLVTSLNDPTAHAEVTAIREACRKTGDFSLKGTVLYASCEPCPMCLSAVYWARIDKVYYAAGRLDAADAGFDDAFIYSDLCRLPQDRSLPLTCIDLPEAEALLDHWKSLPAKIPY